MTERPQVTALDVLRSTQYEHIILPSDHAFSDFLDHVSNHPLRLIPEYCGRFPLGTPDEIRLLNRKVWAARHNADRIARASRPASRRDAAA